MSSIRARIVFVVTFLVLMGAITAGVLIASGRLQVPAGVRDMLGKIGIIGTEPTHPGGPTVPKEFMKEAFDSQGNPIPAGGPVKKGDVISYVLSYPTSMAGAGSIITDKLSPNQTYLDPSLDPDGWSYSPNPPYSVANTTTYTSNGTGMSFVATVPKTMASLKNISDVGGDGTIPIPIGSRVYGIFHHMPINDASRRAEIMCWDLYTLERCDATWPKLLSPSGTLDRTTLQIAKHAVVGTRIYYASASFDGTNTAPGMGCWETSPSEAPCAFIALSSTLTWPGQVDGNSVFNGAATGMDKVAAGVIGLPPSDPNYGRVFMQAGDRVYCFVVTSTPTPCPTWTSSTPFGASPSLGASGPTISNVHARDMVFDDATTPTKLFVGVGNPSGGTNLACLEISTGAFCSGWMLPTITVPMHALSPILDASGNPNGVCVHQFSGYPGTSAAPLCFDFAGNALTALQVGNVPASLVLSAFRMPPPKNDRILYPRFNQPTQCRQFTGTGAVTCTSADFSPAWSAGTYRDYGYAIDPAHSDECLLGLGDGKILWRFRNDGSMQTDPPDPKNPICQYPITYSFNINDKYCGAKPRDASWKSVSLVALPGKELPTELQSGQFEFFLSGVSLGTAIANSGNNFTVNVPAGAGPLLTVKFTPTYNPAGFVPADDYQIIANFTAEIAPQICYKATVNECGAEVSNKATLEFRGPAGIISQSASTNLGSATGEGCRADGVLKVCKAAGAGVTVGTLFNFTAGGKSFSVPAGPKPGGYCVVAGTFAEGTDVPVDELDQPGFGVSDLTVNPPDRVVVPPNLTDGTVTVNIGSGVTEVTYTNVSTTGYLEVCKTGDVKGDFKFEVSGYGTVVVPAGACSPALAVTAGKVKITEGPNPSAQMVDKGCYTLPANRQLDCDAPNQTSVVTVVPGDISTMTIAYITNRPKGKE